MIRLGTRVRLNIGMATMEQLLRALSGQILNRVHVARTGVEPVTGVTFGHGQGHSRGERSPYRPAHVVFRGGQLDLGLLPALLQREKFRYLGICPPERVAWRLGFVEQRYVKLGKHTA